MADLQLLNVNDVHRLLGIPKPSVYNLFHSKGFPSIKIGGRLYVRADSFSRYIEHLEKMRI